MTTVTCVITSFNNMPFIQKTLESVLTQTHPPEEIIIADDGSTDESRTFLQAQSKINDTIRLIFREKNLGVATNRDLAIREASSIFVTTLDGDDIFYSEKIARELVLINGTTDKIAFSDFERIDADGKQGKKLIHTQFAHLSKIDQIRYLLFRQGPIPRDIMFSKKLYAETGGFRNDLKLYEDWDLKLRFANKAREWCYTGYIGIGYRWHENGLSAASPLEHLDQQLNVITGNKDWLKDALGLPDIYNALLQSIAAQMGCKGIQVIR